EGDRRRQEAAQHDPELCQAEVDEEQLQEERRAAHGLDVDRRDAVDQPGSGQPAEGAQEPEDDAQHERGHGQLERHQSAAEQARPVLDRDLDERRHVISGWVGARCFSITWARKRWVRGESGFLKIFPGGPCSTTTPWSIITTEVATSLANSISWVTTTIVWPSSASSLVTFRTSPISSGSRDDVISS